MQPWAKAGLTQYLVSDNSVYATLTAGPDVSPYFAEAGFDQTLGSVALGLDVTAYGQAVLRFDGSRRSGKIRRSTRVT